MIDPRINKLAKILINHSCALKNGERVLVEAVGVPKTILLELIREAKIVGGVPFIRIKNDQIIRELCLFYDENDIKFMAECELFEMKKVDAFIGIRSIKNIYELNGVPKEKIENILKYYISPVHLLQRNESTRPVFLRWPNYSMAQQAGMSTEAFENLFFNACILDYLAFEKLMDPLITLMQKTDVIRIVGPGNTDMQFSIKSLPSFKQFGKRNIPDGEVNTAPVKYSLNGRIHFNVSSVFYGITFHDICLDFKNGKVVNAKSSQTKRLKEVLSIDKGAKYTGEFAFGLNPYLTRPIMDILFDEKMIGSIHLALGNAYKRCDNGNHSAIHWDLVLLQTPEKGGGEIYFDDILIRKDGQFVLEELQELNFRNISQNL